MIKVISGGKYKDVFMLGDSCRATIGFLKTEELNDQIKFVKINDFQAGSKLMSVAGGTMGGVIAGTVGALINSTILRPKIDATLTIYLYSGESIKIKTDDVSLIKFLHQFMGND